MFLTYSSVTEVTAAAAIEPDHNYFQCLGQVQPGFKVKTTNHSSVINSNTSTGGCHFGFLSLHKKQSKQRGFAYFC